MGWTLYWQIVTLVIPVGLFALAIAQERSKKP
jgi:hypothetical protein